MVRGEAFRRKEVSPTKRAQIEAELRGEVSISSGERPRHKEEPQNDSGLNLTSTQVEVIRTYIEYPTYKEVAYRLGISEQTVKNHMYAAHRRLGVTSAIQACIIFDRATRGVNNVTVIERRKGLDRRSGNERRKSVTPQN